MMRVRTRPRRMEIPVLGELTGSPSTRVPANAKEFCRCFRLIGAGGPRESRPYSGCGFARGLDVGRPGERRRRPASQRDPHPGIRGLCRAWAPSGDPRAAPAARDGVPRNLGIHRRPGRGVFREAQGRRDFPTPRDVPRTRPRPALTASSRWIRVGGTFEPQPSAGGGPSRAFPERSRWPSASVAECGFVGMRKQAGRRRALSACRDFPPWDRSP